MLNALYPHLGNALLGAAIGLALGLALRRFLRRRKEQ